MRTKWIFSRNLTLNEVDAIKADRKKTPVRWESSGTRSLDVSGKRFVVTSKPNHSKNLVIIEVTDSEIKNDGFEYLACTAVYVYPFMDAPSLGHIKGLATVVLNDQFLIRGLRVMEGDNGLFVGYPNDPFYKGEDLRFVCNPITSKLREHIENCVLTKYHAMTEGK